MKIWNKTENNPLYIISPRLFCFGVKESKSMEDSSKVAGYQCDIVLIKKK